MALGTTSRIALAASTAMALLQATPALAQEERSGDSALPGEIIVTARRVEERLQDVPISVTVFSQEQISKQNITNSGDLALYTPSLGSSNVLGNNQATFSLRGFNQEISTAPTVGVFFAEVVAPRGASNSQPVGDGAGPGSFFDLQNVQVLKGPQGTLFGRNTTGGAILLVPKKPTDRFEGYLEGSAGNYDMRRIQGVLNIPLSESVRARFGFDRQTREGYIRNLLPIGPSRFSNTDYIAARASLAIDVTPDLENYTIATYVRSDTNGELNGLIAAQQVPALTIPGLGTLPGATVFPGLPGTTSTTRVGALPFLAQAELDREAGAGFYTGASIKPNARVLLNQWQVINTTTWHSSDALTVKNIISYAQLKYSNANAVLGVGLDLADFNPFGQTFLNLTVNARLPAGTPPFVFQPYPRGTYLQFTDSDPRLLGSTSHQSTFTEELQLQGRALANALTWQAGVYFEDSRPLSEGGSISGNLANCPSADLVCSNPFFGFGSVGLTASEKKLRSVGTYAQASYDLTEKLKLTGGFRYTWDSQIAGGRLVRYAVPFSPNNPLQATTLNQTFVSTSPPGSSSNAARCVIPTASSANGCAETVTQKSSAPTWLVGLDYKPNEDMLIYAKYARGYRTGGVSFQLPDSFRTFAPEKVDTYELGLKSTFSGGGLRGVFNLAAFYNDFSNQQIPASVTPKVVGTAAQSTGVANAGRSRIYGLEAEASVELFRGFIVSGSYAYLNTRIKELAFPAFNDPLLFLDLSRVARVGDSLPLTPSHKVSVSLAYTLPLDKSVGEITVGSTFTYTGAQIISYAFRDAAGQVTGLSQLAPRNLLDANLTWKGIGGSPVDLSLFANNITKQQYYTFILDAGIGVQGGQRGLPRMYGMRVRFNFGQ